MTMRDCPRGGENLTGETGIPVDDMSVDITHAALQDLCQGLTSDGLPASLLMRYLFVKQQFLRPGSNKAQQLLDGGRNRR